MNAIEFVKEFGVESAVKIIRSAPASATSYRVYKNSKLGLVGAYGRVNNANYYVTSLCELKQIVEAFELVEKAGGLDESKSILGNVKPWSRGYNIISNTYFGGDIFSDEQEFYISDLLKAIELVEKCNASD